MKNAKYEKMYQLYKQGLSLQKVGKIFKMTRQGVYDGFKRRGFKLRTKKKLEFQTFNGNRYTLRNTGYLAKTTGNRSLMHRDVWEYHKGKIPEGYDIHHINHKKTDNRIENLEIYTKAEHASKFATGHNRYTKKV